MKQVNTQKSRDILIGEGVRFPDGARRFELKCGHNILVVYASKTGRSLRVFNRRADELRTFGDWKGTK